MAEGPGDTTLEQARRDYEARRWAEALAGFETARRSGPLPLPDADRFAWCHVWTLAPAAHCIGAFEELETMAIEADDPIRAARAALEQARMHAMLENDVLVISCYLRASECAGGDEPTMLLIGMYPALGATTRGDFARAREISEDVLPRARALGDRTLEALAVSMIGTGLVLEGGVDDGLALLDEAMTIATTADVHPLYAGMITCGVVMTCRGIGDWQRAKEWTEVADRYCSRQAVCHYPGHCSTFRSELRRLDGDLAEASEQALTSLEQCGDWSRAWTGAAHHQHGEAELCRGNLIEAQAAFASAIEWGFNPQPGQAQLHLFAGDADAAFRSIRDAIDHQGVLALADRLPMLVTAVGIAITADEFERGKEWTDLLGDMADRYGTAAASAAFAQASGQIALAEGAVDDAVDQLRLAVQGWADAGSPLHAARGRALLADALDARGEAPDAGLERTIARSVFERLGAVLDLSAIDDAKRDPVRLRRTLSFTDIVGSSELLAAMGDDAWAQVLGAHDRLLRATLSSFGGREVKHEGDGLFVAFEAEDAAVEWAIAVQRGLAEHRGSHGFAPQIRIGVHSGDALQYGDDFIGRCVHETARIANAAGAGQIFVSESTFSALGRERSVVASHELDLKGFERPQPVLEIDWSS